MHDARLNLDGRHARHQPLDPVIVAGPWLLADWGTYKVGKRVARLLR